MSDRKRVLVAAAGKRNLELLQQFLGQEGFETLPAGSLDDMRLVLEQTPNIDIAVFDISGFSSEVWAFCDKLRERIVPFVVISGARSAGLEDRAARSGARVVMTKPLVVRNLIRVIRAMLEPER
jgi:DNA-binding response OmpR family regulator